MSSKESHQLKTLRREKRVAAENKLPLQFTFSSRMEGSVTHACVYSQNEPGCPL